MYMIKNLHPNIKNLALGWLCAVWFAFQNSARHPSSKFSNRKDQWPTLRDLKTGSKQSSHKLLMHLEFWNRIFSVWISKQSLLEKWKDVNRPEISKCFGKVLLKFAGILKNRNFYLMQCGNLSMDSSHFLHVDLIKSTIFFGFFP